MVPPASASSASGGNGSADPHQWLESILGPKQLQWVEQRNSDCFQSVGDPRKTESYDRILTILDSKDKIPNVYRIGEKYYYNFWQDDQHVQGIWRRTTLDSYRKGGGKEDGGKDGGEGGEGGGGDTTDWTTVIDLDALPPPTGEGTETATTWVWHGSTLLKEGPNRARWEKALIELSPGGSDADTCREFNLEKERWVHVDPSTEEGGFEMSTPAKTSISYRSRNEVLVGTDFGGDGSTLTDSGYPRIVKSWRRGTSIDDAVTVPPTLLPAREEVLDPSSSAHDIAVDLSLASAWEGRMLGLFRSSRTKRGERGSGMWPASMRPCARRWWRL